MFCPNCGVELNIPLQNFCYNCGTKIPIISKVHQTEPEDIMQKTPVKIEKGPGSHSKKCLAFALISLGIGLFAYYFGSNVIGYMVFRTMFKFPYFNYDERTVKTVLRILIIIFIFLHIFGLYLGILSRKESKKAGDLEPINSVERAGSVFSILGIIANIIALVVSVIFAFIVFIYL